MVEEGGKPVRPQRRQDLLSTHRIGGEDENASPAAEGGSTGLPVKREPFLSALVKEDRQARTLFLERSEKSLGRQGVWPQAFFILRISLRLARSRPTLARGHTEGLPLLPGPTRYTPTQTSQPRRKSETNEIAWWNAVIVGSPENEAEDLGAPEGDSVERPDHGPQTPGRGIPIPSSNRKNHPNPPRAAEWDLDAQAGDSNTQRLLWPKISQGARYTPRQENPHRVGHGCGPGGGCVNRHGPSALCLMVDPLVTARRVHRP